MAETAGRFLAAILLVVVAVIGGIALSLEFPRSADTTETRPPTLTSTPASETKSIALQSTLRSDAVDSRPALAPAVRTASEVVHPPQQPATPDATVSAPLNAAPPSTAALTPQTARAIGTISPETKGRRTDGMSRINFDFGSDRINDASRQTLDRIVFSMKTNPGWRLAIEGHTDAQGTPEYNQALSERRAQAVKAYLQSSGIALERLSAYGVGASRPAGPNAALGNVVNRRVEFRRQ